MYPFRQRPYHWILLIAACLFALGAVTPLHAQTEESVTVTPTVELPTMTPTPEQTATPGEPEMVPPVPEDAVVLVALAPITATAELPTVTPIVTVELPTVTPMPAQTEIVVALVPLTVTAELPTVTPIATVELLTVTLVPTQTEIVAPTPLTLTAEIATATLTATVALPIVTPVLVQTAAPVGLVTVTPVPAHVEPMMVTPVPAQLAELVTLVPLTVTTELATIPLTATVALLTAIPGPEETNRSALDSTDITEHLVISIVEQPSFAFTLDGHDQVVDATLLVLLTDKRSEDSGWHLQIASVQIIDPSTGRTLHNAVLTIPSVAVACVQPPCTLPDEPVSGGTVPLNTILMEPVKFLNASPGSGTGEFAISPTLRLYVPASAYAGDYQVIVAVTIISDPAG